MRTIAVDWSGKASNAARTIWVAEVVDGELVFLENGRTRNQVADFLIHWAAEGARLVVGIDFAFSFPAWFLHDRGLHSVYELWAMAATNGEEWLQRCPPPFWGRPGKPKPDFGALDQFRRTDRQVPATGGIRPKSVFQIGGAGSVGTASIRGMNALLALRSAGFSVWPFDPPSGPTVIEIYPRLLTGPVRKSSADERQTYLAGGGLRGSEAIRRTASSNEDAFDAAVSALVMWEHRAELAQLVPANDDLGRLEGSIWYPLDLKPLGLGRPDLSRALAKMQEWHYGQARKGKPSVAYVGHLMGVASIVIEAGGSDTLAVSALLHDSLEDQPNVVTPELLESQFGPEVAGIVKECSDSDPSAPDEPRDEATWWQRRERYIEQLSGASLDAVKVSLADKLYNARAIRMDQAWMGAAFWEPFNAKRPAQVAYYRQLVTAFEARHDLDGPWRHLVNELAEAVEAIAATQ